ncbi:hypothetical protein [Winogradskyella pulchriflava]|uniref:Uncharacterized protein n=1 Tax=Winogradskyella pulchriflava TaxID=1110688 RepID=A0ABV6Q517_9FLAO
MKKEITSNFLVAASMILVVISQLLDDKSIGWVGYAAIILILIAVFRIVKGYLE